MYPEDYKYSTDHEWVRIDGDVCVVGITDYAQDELGEVVFVETPAAGQTFSAHDEVGSIRGQGGVVAGQAELVGLPHVELIPQVDRLEHRVELVVPVVAPPQHHPLGLEQHRGTQPAGCRSPPARGLESVPLVRLGAWRSERARRRG